MSRPPVQARLSSPVPYSDFLAQPARQRRSIRCKGTGYRRQIVPVNQGSNGRTREREREREIAALERQ